MNGKQIVNHDIEGLGQVVWPREYTSVRGRQARGVGRDASRAVGGRRGCLLSARPSWGGRRPVYAGQFLATPSSSDAGQMGTVNRLTAAFSMPTASRTLGPPSERGMM